MLKDKKLQKLIDKLDKDGIEYSSFSDTFFDNKVRAIAAMDIEDYVKELELI